MSEARGEFDVAVLGDHPCAWLATSLLARRDGVRVLHVTQTGAPVNDRVVLLNPQFFKLDKSLNTLKPHLTTRPVNGLHILGNEEGLSNKHVGETLAYLVREQEVNALVREAARQSSATCIAATSLNISRPDAQGVELSIDSQHFRAKAIIVGAVLSQDQRRTLGIPAGWDADVRRRLCYLDLPRDLSTAPQDTAAMSLDLNGTLRWAWMMVSPDAVHLTVEQPADASAGAISRAMTDWMRVLITHGLLKQTVSDENVRSEVVPLAGALSQDGVADRTLLIGPAGGFFSACAEDIYPNCWSALFAVDVICHALHQPLLQDALDDYRSCWRTTLGVYLQGPQQNLRFLLPMIYRNAAMTSRLAEAIFSGKSVVH